MGVIWRPEIILLMVLVALWRLCEVAPATIRRITDECDWSGSGVDEMNGGIVGVQPIYLRCREGSIQWMYPRGALRVVLRFGHSNKDFQVCLKVSWNSSGANLFVEGFQDLKLLHGHSDSKNASRQQCLRSTDGQVALYLEAEGMPDSLKKSSFQFMYDLQPIQPNSFSECRPCTDRELIYSFCTSDFVIRGTISALYENEPMQRTELYIKSKQILRDSENRVFQSLPPNRTVQQGVVYRPLSCGTKAGLGEFLFLGRWRLGDPVLRCAPRWTEWKRVRRKAAEHVDCILE